MDRTICERNAPESAKRLLSLFVRHKMLRLQHGRGLHDVIVRLREAVARASDGESARTPNRSRVKRV